MKPIFLKTKFLQSSIYVPLNLKMVDGLSSFNLIRAHSQKTEHFYKSLIYKDVILKCLSGSGVKIAKSTLITLQQGNAPFDI